MFNPLKMAEMLQQANTMQEEMQRKLSQTVVEGTITKWLNKPGDKDERRLVRHCHRPLTGAAAPKTAAEIGIPSSAKRSVNRGRTPVGMGLPRNLPLASIPAE